MNNSEESYKKDSMMKDAFLLLSSRKISSTWLDHEKPYTALEEECKELMRDLKFVSDLRKYLDNKLYISRSVKMLLTYMSMSENSRWQETPEWMHPVTTKGWYLIRWIPTALGIDGPIGRFLLRENSPIYPRLGNNIPLITAAKEFLYNKDFKALRNGLAHWSFDWEISTDNIYIVIYKEGKDSILTKMSINEVNGFHTITFGLTEILDSVFFKSNLS
ncbi:MAG: hypothetical protein JNK81_06500 [Anaerolineales bacterium]|nr:hypothetical protein [Anaerolineales bacterium]